MINCPCNVAIINLHTYLCKQLRISRDFHDFIEALRAAKDFTSKISDKLNVSAFGIHPTSNSVISSFFNFLQFFYVI